ncbi:NUDIX domain-containing protein [Aeromicrobium phoceense]|uniref:NUDIX domain-containing protein n=1 Tax=Aeromicrobium phoceense TaxID=2754045 RepID=UPI0019D60D0C
MTEPADSSPTLRDDDLVLEPTSGADDLHGFAVLHEGERIGTVALQSAHGKAGRRLGTMRWNLSSAPGAMVASRALRLGVGYAFDQLGWTRIEARVPADDALGQRAASIAGLRREGIARSPGGEPDLVLLGRIVDDPPAFSRDGFVAILNAGLPRKRVIGQGILRDRDGRVLLCELTYKREWDLPGGVVEVGESPATGLVRELEEELGITVEVEGLVTMNWLPAWSRWDDACLFVFDLGVVDAELVEQMVLQRTEIAAVHWCDLDTVRERATLATTELLESLADAPLPAYREAPRQPDPVRDQAR